MKDRTRQMIERYMYDLGIDRELRTDFLQLPDLTPTETAIAQTALNTGLQFVALLQMILEEEGKPEPSSNVGLPEEGWAIIEEGGSIADNAQRLSDDCQSTIDRIDAILFNEDFNGTRPMLDGLVNPLLVEIEGWGWDIIGFGGGDIGYDDREYREFAFRLPNGDHCELTIQEEEGGSFALIGYMARNGNMYASIEGLTVANPPQAMAILQAMANRPQEEGSPEEEGGSDDLLDDLNFDDCDIDLDWLDVSRLAKYLD